MPHRAFIILLAQKTGNVKSLSLTIREKCAYNENMNRQIVAVILQEGGKFITELIKTRSFKRVTVTGPPPATIITAIEPQKIPEESREEKIEEGTACLPCVNSHMHACVGLLNEASRFAKKSGINEEVIKRTDGCLGEIVAAERIDLAPENVVSLPPEEKKIADYASKELREIRHSLEGLSSPDELEQIAARTAKLQHYVGNEWFKYRLGKMPKEQKRELAEKAVNKLLEEE